MEALLGQIKGLAGAASEASRQKIISSLRSLLLSLESPDDTIHRYGHMSLQTSAIKIGFDLGVFKSLCDADTSLTVDEIAKSTTAEPLLIHAIAEISVNQFAPSNVTRNLTEKSVEAGLSHYCKIPVDENYTAFQDGWKTELPTFQRMGQNPKHLGYFNDYMSARRQPDLSWLSVYPVEQELKGWQRDGDKTVYVNIGGGIGPQCKQFKERYPDVVGRVVLEDLPHSIEKALQTPGVENLPHDFFKPQPIKGAKFC